MSNGWWVFLLEEGDMFLFFDFVEVLFCFVVSNGISWVFKFGLNFLLFIVLKKINIRRIKILRGSFKY